MLVQDFFVHCSVRRPPPDNKHSAMGEGVPYTGDLSLSRSAVLGRESERRLAQQKQTKTISFQVGITAVAS